MANESIVATGIYYIDVDNITETQLHFRQAIEEPGKDIPRPRVITSS